MNKFCAVGAVFLGVSGLVVGVAGAASAAETPALIAGPADAVT